MSTESALVGERSELLARVALTRRLNIDVLNFGAKSDQGIDMIGTIKDQEVQGFLPFGVVVWGTTGALETSAEADHFGRKKVKDLKDTSYFMPVIALLFSMQNDEAYFAWLVEPDTKSGRLMNWARPHFKPFGQKQLDLMIRKIVNWYGRMKHVIVTESHDTGPHRKSDEE
jgi:hypothetical protein